MRFDSYGDGTASLAADLVNTYSVVTGREKLSRASLEKLLAAHGIPARRISERELGDFRRLRERLRELFTATEAKAVRQLNAMLDETGCTPQLVRHGGEEWHLHVGSTKRTLLDRVAAAAALGLLLVIRDEGTGRFKLCAGRACADVFVDVSRNRSRRFCSPQVCGNRAHARAHRARRKAER